MAARHVDNQPPLTTTNPPTAVLAPLNRDTIDYAAVYDVYQNLPPRQRRIVDLLVGRREPKQIAREMRVAVSTVRTQLHTLQSKFDADSNHELALIIANTLYAQAANDSRESSRNN
jgi:DNA-binding NarL/FixJ family response regulator